MHIISTSILLLLLLVCAPCPANAVHFLLTDNEPYCFVEEVGENTKAVSGEYTRISVRDGDHIDAKIIIERTDGVVVSENKLLVGTHSFSANTNHLYGQYRVCVQVTSSSWNAGGEEGIPVEFNADQKFDAVSDAKAPVVQRQKVNGEEVFTFREFGGQQKDVLKPVDYIQRVETGLGYLSVLLEETRSENHYLIGRFNRIRRTSESTFTRIWSCGVVIVAVAILVIWSQFHFLKLTLRRKKLI